MSEFGQNQEIVMLDGRSWYEKAVRGAAWVTALGSFGLAGATLIYAGLDHGVSYA